MTKTNGRTRIAGWLIALAAFSWHGAQAETIQLGLGYDRARNGHGFDLHRAGETYILYFYTYNSAGAPEWFVGIADMDSGVIAGDLLRFTYDHAAPQSERSILDTGMTGSFSLDFANPLASPGCNDGTDRSGAQQLAAFYWQTGADSGEWCTELLAFGASNGSDPYLGGTWYAGDSDPGYGFTLAHMDDTVVGVFYYYDSAGEPRWALGTADDVDPSIALDHFNGYCRTCAPVATTSAAAGTLELDFDESAPPGSGTDLASVALSYPQQPFGEFERDFTLARLSDGSSSGEFEASEAAAFYAAFISEPVVQAKCILCHVQGGVSGNTRLVFQKAGAPNYQAANLQTFRDFVAEVAGGDALILSKVSNQVSHGGGEQLPAGSTEYDDLATLLALLVAEGNPSSGDDLVKAFLEGVDSIDPERSLRKAALLFAGRLPTEPELAAVAGGGQAALRTTIRGLMQGEGFHAFLIEGANDRLLTDKFVRERILDERAVYFPNYVNALYELNQGRDDDDPEARQALNQFRQDTRFGIARAPLELIAHVVENERPYTEILTADYVMTNPAADLVYGSGLTFADPENRDEWQPGEILDYVRIDETSRIRCNQGGCEVLGGGLPTDFPEAGVLNTLAFLSRYPSTATNRNRARARWTYYYFLDVDIEKLAPRTIDPVALADTDNPTMNNPACTVCHQVHDPVAGAFQNYGDEGFYKDSFGGQDSLPQSYKFPEDDSPSLYSPGDVWYADMREPGFAGQLAPDEDASVQWLAEEIVTDSRFPNAAVKFWWPAVFGVEPVNAPEEPSDAGFATQQQAFEAQKAFVAQLATDFRDGGFNLKDLLADMAASDWFRGETIDGVEDTRKDALAAAGIGVENLLTPEQLHRKLEATTGYSWSLINPGNGREFPLLSEVYNLYYGGINSDSITRRARDMTPLMTKVVTTMALESACPIVVSELSVDAADRTLLAAVEATDTPDDTAAEARIRAALKHLHERLLGEALADSDPELDRSFELFADVWNARVARNEAPAVDTACGFLSGDGPLPEIPDPLQTVNTWIAVMSYFLTDYRFIHG